MTFVQWCGVCRQPDGLPARRDHSAVDVDSRADITAALFAWPRALTSVWRPGVERVAQQLWPNHTKIDPASPSLFYGSRRPRRPGKEVRVTGIGPESPGAWSSGFEAGVTRGLARVRWSWTDRCMAHARLGGIRGMVGRTQVVYRAHRRSRFSAPPGRQESCWSRRRLAALGLHRRHCREPRFITGLLGRMAARRLAWLENSGGVKSRIGRICVCRCPAPSSRPDRL